MCGNLIVSKGSLYVYLFELNLRNLLYVIKRSDIVVIDVPLLDTRREKNLLGTLISDLILSLLSYCSDNEYRIIHQRQAEGIAAAKLRE